MTVLLVALLGTICWGIAPILGKLGLARVDPATGLAIRTLIAAGFIAGWLVATGHVREIRVVPHSAWPFIAGEALLATLIGDLAYFAALKWGEVSDVATVMAASPLVTLWAAFVFLNEEMNWPRLLGALMITMGLFLVGIQARP